MRDTSTYCECCGKREQAGQCVKGSVMCPCDTDRDGLIHTAILCPDCEKCPTHGKCNLEKCTCATKYFGHKAGCIARSICLYKIKREKAKEDLEKVERILKSYGVEI